MKYSTKNKYHQENNRKYRGYGRAGSCNNNATMMNLLFMLILPLTTTAFTTRLFSRAYTSIGISRTQSLFGASYKVNHQHKTQFHVHQRQSIRFMSASEDKGVMADKKTKILGVCGGIGSGKSHACELMVDSLGCVARIGEPKIQFSRMNNI